MKYYLDDLFPSTKQPGAAQIPFLYSPAYLAKLNSLLSAGNLFTDPAGRKYVILSEAESSEVFKNSPHSTSREIVSR